MIQNSSSLNQSKTADGDNGNSDEEFAVEDFVAALFSLDKAFEMAQTFRPPNDPFLAMYYNNIGDMLSTDGCHSYV